jgi:uncharacterized protein (TIGR02246 family)
MAAGRATYRVSRDRATAETALKFADQKNHLEGSNMIKLAGRALVLGGMSLGLASAAIASDADVLREAKDRAEIEQLMWRYVRALDSFDAEAYASVYTEDGQFSAGGNATKGREALRNMVTGIKQGRDARAAAGETVTPLYHMIANSRIEFLGPDEARFHSYWMTVAGAAGQETPPRVLAAGRGIDELVRVNGAWLIKSRDVTPQN